MKISDARKMFNYPIIFNYIKDDWALDGTAGGIEPPECDHHSRQPQAHAHRLCVPLRGRRYRRSAAWFSHLRRQTIEERIQNETF